ETVVAQSGRILVFLNTFASFGPRILTSDDNGQTWRSIEPFGNVSGLTGSETGQGRVEIAQVQVSPTGRLVARSENHEILTSDDEGESWIVRIDANFNQPSPPNLFWESSPLAHVDGRWI